MNQIFSSEINVTRDERVESAPSSKGNQIKWRTRDALWLKADDFGYEGLAEVASSQVLAISNIHSYVHYSPCLINEDSINYRGCVSNDFLAPGETLITLYRLLESNGYNADSLFSGKSTSDRLMLLIDLVTKLTALNDFNIWLGRLLEFDAFILNEDRHLNNIAVILLMDGTFKYMPVFDNGAAFLSDTRRDYPISAPIIKLIDKVRSKPIATHFDKQLKSVRDVIGFSLKLSNALILDLSSCCQYDSSEKTRVEKIISKQSTRYSYLFE